MITLKQYKEAIKLIQDYNQQEADKQMFGVADRKVRLSPFGLTMEREGGEKKQIKATDTGIITDRMLAGMHDYNVFIVWDNGKSEWRHESQVEKIK